MQTVGASATALDTSRRRGRHCGVQSSRAPACARYDAEGITNPGNYGFTYGDGGNSATITNVEIASTDEVRIALSAAPTGANRLLRYAQNGVPGGTCPGPTRGARGNLRDSDATVAYHTDASGQPYELFNWAVHST